MATYSLSVWPVINMADRKIIQSLSALFNKINHLANNPSEMLLRLKELKFKSAERVVIT